MSKLNLIVADDHPIFRDGICSVLRRQEFISKISQAGDGTEVIRLLELEHYDLVLLDIRMEPMNGFKTMEIIASRFKEVKVIALSMSSEDKYVREMINLGAVGYLLKNAGKKEIIQAIKSVVRGATYFRPMCRIQF
ncbi:MAG: response regulator transcription factor [Bacteroidetes bacterium]|nr:response regulator transcription factor [Bacteroidota bacterium]